MAGELFALLLQAISNDDDRAAVGAALGALAAALRAAGPCTASGFLLAAAESATKVD